MHRSFEQAEFPAAGVAAAVDATPTEWTRIESAGYGRVNAHWRASLDDGTSVFVKQALTREADEWVRKERRIYEDIRGSFLPTFRGAGEAGHAFVVIEDLSGADWPPPWSDERIDRVLHALDELHATAAPSWLPKLDDVRDAVVGWPAVQTDPAPLLGTGVCTREWLEPSLPPLLEAVAGSVLAGNDLLHFDVRSDNICFAATRTLFVDWNLAHVGNGAFDVAFWLPSLRLEGGPEPHEVLPDAGPLAAAVAGFFACRAGLPPPEGAPTVREFQLAQLRVALPWAARELGLPAPTLPA